MRYQKLSELIRKLENARHSYIAKHGIEPTIWEWDEYEGLQLCAGITRGDGATYSKRPYKSYRRIKPVTR